MLPALSREVLTERGHQKYLAVNLGTFSHGREDIDVKDQT